MRALPSVTRDPPRSRMEEGWIDMISEVISRAETSVSRSSRDATALAEPFRQVFVFSISSPLIFEYEHVSFRLYGSSTSAMLLCETCGLDFTSMPSSVHYTSSLVSNLALNHRNMSPLDSWTSGGGIIMETPYASRQSEHEIRPTCEKSKWCIPSSLALS